MKMFFRLPIALLVIFLASNLVAAMDQRIPEGQIRCAAQRFVNTLLAVNQPPYETELLAASSPYHTQDDEELNDPSKGFFWVPTISLHRYMAAKIMTTQDKAEAQIARYYCDPEFIKWAGIELGDVSWNIPARAAVLYPKTLRTLVNRYSISHQDYEKVFSETSYRLSGAIFDRLTQGFWYSKLVHFNREILYADPYNQQANQMMIQQRDQLINSIDSYNKELRNWHAEPGVVEGIHERIGAAGVQEIAMRTYKTTDIL
jgi:hypothetical protein